MEFVNNSEHVIRAGVHSALPLGPGNAVARIGDTGTGGKHSVDLKPGSYYFAISNSNIGPLPAGTLIAQTGGVTESSTVTLTENDRIVVT